MATGSIRLCWRSVFELLKNIDQEINDVSTEVSVLIVNDGSNEEKEEAKQARKNKQETSKQSHEGQQRARVWCLGQRARVWCLGDRVPGRREGQTNKTNQTKQTRNTTNEQYVNTNNNKKTTQT